MLSHTLPVSVYRDLVWEMCFLVSMDLGKLRGNGTELPWMCYEHGNVPLSHLTGLWTAVAWSRRKMFPVWVTIVRSQSKGRVLYCMTWLMEHFYSYLLRGTEPQTKQVLLVRGFSACDWKNDFLGPGLCCEGLLVQCYWCFQCCGMQNAMNIILHWKEIRKKEKDDSEPCSKKQLSVLTIECVCTLCYL